MGRPVPLTRMSQWLMSASSVKASASARGLSFIEGISKSSFVKKASDLKGSSIKMNVNDVYLSYLPLAHIFDWVIAKCFINHGASIGFWRGDVKLLLEDIGVLQPTIFCVVP